eukprot:2991756-Pyramimonas_sp.AAC.1
MPFLRSCCCFPGGSSLAGRANARAAFGRQALGAGLFLLLSLLPPPLRGVVLRRARAGTGASARHAKHAPLPKREPPE